jgi:hypothetical protein
MALLDKLLFIWKVISYDCVENVTFYNSNLEKLSVDNSTIGIWLLQNNLL